MSAGQDLTRGMDGGAGGTPPEPDRRDRRKLWLIAAGVLAAGLLVGGLAGAVATGASDDTTASGQTVAADVTTTTSPPPVTSTDPGDQGGGNQGQPAVPPTTPKEPLPTIVSFTPKVTSIACLTPGVDLKTTVYWSTKDALGVGLQVGNKIEAAFGPNGQADVAVHCTGQPTTYTLTAKGLGGETAQTISVATQVPTPAILALKVGPESVICQQGQGDISVLVSWSVKNADTIQLQGAPVSASGAKSFTVPCDGNDQTFVLKATGLGGQVSGHTTVDEVLFKT